MTNPPLWRIGHQTSGTWVYVRHRRKNRHSQNTIQVELAKQVEDPDLVSQGTQELLRWLCSAHPLFLQMIGGRTGSFIKWQDGTRSRHQFGTTVLIIFIPIIQLLRGKIILTHTKMNRLLQGSMEGYPMKSIPYIMSSWHSSHQDGFFGGIILPSYVWIIVSRYKDLYLKTSVSWKVIGFFFRGSYSNEQQAAWFKSKNTPFLYKSLLKLNMDTPKSPHSKGLLDLPSGKLT